MEKQAEEKIKSVQNAVKGDMAGKRNEKNPPRMANLELLRIIAMLLIIMLHLMNHGSIIYCAKEGTWSYYVAWVLFGIGFISINVYLLISGYFLVDSRFSTWKAAKLGGQVFFYAFGITALFWLFGDVEHELKYMVFSVIPIASDFYWFISMYIGMYLLSPLMNKLIRALTRRQLGCACALCFLLVSVWPNIVYFSSTLNTAGGVSISWFLSVYLFGAYLKLYYKPDGRFGKKFLLACGAVLLIPLSRFAIEAMLKTPLSRISILEDLMWGYSVFYNYSSILATLAAVLMFVAFLNLEIKSVPVSRVINVAAGTAFGVYLLHDHYYIRETFWPLLNAPYWPGNWWMVPYAIGTVLGIYLVGMVVELLRQKLFAPIDNSPRIRGFFLRIDDRLRAIWHGIERNGEV